MQEIITIGNKVDMEALVHGNVEKDESKRRVLSCRVMDIPSDSIVRISMPFHEGRIVPLSVGDQYQMTIFSDRGIYASQFVVVHRLKEGNLFLADMEMQRPLKKVQRREFFRHDCRIPASYRMISEKEELGLEEEDSPIDWKKGVILDISGGGLRMVSEHHETANQIIQIRFILELEGELREFIEFGKLIASIRRENVANLYEQRVEFEQIGDKDREQIIRYIFDEERKKISRDKGLN